MTIREYVERRATVGRIVLVLGVLVELVVLLTMFPRLVGLLGTLAFLIGLVPVLGLPYVVSRTAKCPRCRGSLSDITAQEMGPAPSKLPDRCPHCGVGIDDELRERR